MFGRLNKSFKVHLQLVYPPQIDENSKVDCFLQICYTRVKNRYLIYLKKMFKSGNWLLCFSLVYWICCLKRNCLWWTTMLELSSAGFSSLPFVFILVVFNYWINISTNINTDILLSRLACLLIVNYLYSVLPKMNEIFTR